MKKSTARKLTAAFLTAALAFSATGCGSQGGSGNTQETTAAARQTYTNLSQLEGKRIGMQPGTNMDQTVLTKISKAQFKNYSTYTDMVAALRSDSIDAFPADEPVIMEFVASNSDLAMINEYLETFDLAYAFPKDEDGKKLCDEMSAYLDGLNKDGTLKKLMEKWTGADESAKKLADGLTDLPATNGTLNMVTEGDYEPFNYFKDGVITGYDIEIAAMFCKEKGYALKVSTLEFSKIVDAVSNGSYDFAGAGITITDQRAEKVYFSSPNYSGGVTMCVMAPQ